MCFCPAFSFDSSWDGSIDLAAHQTHEEAKTSVCLITSCVRASCVRVRACTRVCVCVCVLLVLVESRYNFNRVWRCRSLEAMFGALFGEEAASDEVKSAGEDSLHHLAVASRTHAPPLLASS